MQALDVFSCIGCHTIGFQRAGIETTALCEFNPYRRAVLARRFPSIPIYEDVRDGQAFADIKADIIIGGPPCQATSKAAAIHGKRTGQSLWSAMRSVGLFVGAQWFVVEQPPGNKAWEAEVSRDLCRADYHVARFEFGANDLGAPYLRRRVFLVACTSLSRLEIARETIPSAIESVKGSANARGDWHPSKLRTVRVATSLADGLERRERIEALGDSNPPHMAEVIGRVIVAGVCLA